MLCLLVVSTVTVLFFGRCLVSRHWQHLQPLLLQQIQQQSLGHCHLHRAMMASSQVPRTTEMWRGFTGSKWSKGIKIWPYLAFYLLLPAASVFPGCVITCKKKSSQNNCTKHAGAPCTFFVLKLKTSRPFDDHLKYLYTCKAASKEQSPNHVCYV